MDQPTSSRPLSQHRSLLVLVGIFALLICAALVGAYSLYRPQLAGLFAAATATPSCIESRLVAGSASYRIQPTPSEPGGTLPAIPSEPDVVFWSGGDSPSYLLVFNPDRQNQVALATLKAGMTVSVNWDDCSVGTYTIQSVELRPVFNLEQVDPDFIGVTLYLPLDGSGRGLVVIAKTMQPNTQP